MLIVKRDLAAGMRMARIRSARPFFLCRISRFLHGYAESYGSAEAIGRISKGGKMQGATERRSEIMKILCRRRSETVGNLAFEFGVSERTIRRDIEVLSLSEPIYTQSGRYGGGVYVEEGYSMYRMYMTETELRVLNKIDGLASAYGLDDGEMQVLHSIISAYTKPGKRNGAPN